MTSNITFAGLGSGIDTNSIISKLMDVERGSVRKLQTQQTNYEKQLSIVKDLNSRLQALQTAAGSLATASSLQKYAAVVADDSALTAAAGAGAAPGVYDVEVLALATAERTYSDAFDASDAAGLFGEGSLSITIGADVVEIEIDASDTLESVVSKINSSGAAATAGLFFTGTQYRMQVTGNETGAANGITFVESGTLALGLDNPANEYRAAADASLKIDGHPMTSETNLVSDAIPGVTLELLAETDGDTEVRVTPDREAMALEVTSFVDAYNRVVSLIAAEFTFTGEPKGADRLAGDATLRSIQRQLGGAISGQVQGLSGALSALAQLGISTERDGSLKMDAEALDDALASGLADVVELFAGSDDGAVSGVADIIEDLVEGFIDFSDGVLTAKESGLTSNIDRLEDQIAAYENRLAEMEQRLLMQFTDMEVVLGSLTSQMSYLSNLSQLL